MNVWECMVFIFLPLKKRGLVCTFRELACIVCNPLSRWQTCNVEWLSIKSASIYNLRVVLSIFEHVSIAIRKYAVHTITHNDKSLWILQHLDDYFWCASSKGNVTLVCSCQDDSRAKRKTWMRTRRENACLIGEEWMDLHWHQRVSIHQSGTSRELLIFLIDLPTVANQHALSG